jgi:hypothetical protein
MVFPIIPPGYGNSRRSYKWANSLFFWHWLQRPVQSTNRMAMSRCITTLDPSLHKCRPIPSPFVSKSSSYLAPTLFSSENIEQWAVDLQLKIEHFVSNISSNTLCAISDSVIVRVSSCLHPRDVSLLIDEEENKIASNDFYRVWRNRMNSKKIAPKTCKMNYLYKGWKMACFFKRRNQ